MHCTLDSPISQTKKVCVTKLNKNACTLDGIFYKPMTWLNHQTSHLKQTNHETHPKCDKKTKENFKISKHKLRSLACCLLFGVKN